MWVPVAVIDDDGVSGGEVDAQAPRPGGQQEDEDVRVGVEGTDGFLAVLPAHAAIDAAGLVALPLQVGIQQVQHLGHLGTRQTDAGRAELLTETMQLTATWSSTLVICVQTDAGRAELLTEKMQLTATWSSTLVICVKASRHCKG